MWNVWRSDGTFGTHAAPCTIPARPHTLDRSRPEVPTQVLSDTHGSSIITFTPNHPPPAGSRVSQQARKLAAKTVLKPY